MRIPPDRRPVLRGLAWLAAASAILLAGRPALADAKPAKPDNRLQPKQVSFTASVTPSEAKAGETVKYQVTAKLEPSWHIYAYAPEQPETGPRSTQFDFFDTAGLKPKGGWTASKGPIRKKDEAFPERGLLEYFEDEVTWSISLLIPPGTEPGKKVLRSQVYYQLCNESGCISPSRTTVPEAVLTVLPGGAAAGAAAVSEPPAEPAPARPKVELEKVTVSEASKPDKAPAANAATSEVQRTLEQGGIVPFLLLSMGAGLLALVMPCVWPMVPITVNFFVKQGHAKKGRTTGLAITYCLAIIGIFTLVGVLFSAVFGASALQNLASSAWLNILVAVLFLAFGLSLLGLFEFRLPNFVLNASAQGESRGGLIGVVFMALTLTITSFTCTFPVVGGLLVMAAGGSYLYPIIGLATFATVLALPFFLLALAPGLLSRVPKSGDWMNAVKVVGGLVEIGAAFKFINNAEIGLGTVPDEAWFDAQVVLTIWAVLAFVCGIYLLGLFRTDHDHDAVKVGPGRLLAGSLFVVLGLYLTPALFGHPPIGRVWDRVFVALLPPDVGKLKQTALAQGNAPGGGRVKATSTDPEEALRQEKTFHGVTWGMSYEAALAQARAENKPVLIDFTGVFCTNCRQMEESVMPRPDVVPLLEKFVTVQLYTDRVPIETIGADAQEELAQVNQLRQQKLGETTNPFYVTLSPSGEVLETIGGLKEPPVFIDFLKKALNKYQDRNKVARADLPSGP
jgi:thiol:disulfide interchange protein DsbD